jgi:hypothetical protein
VGFVSGEKAWRLAFGVWRLVFGVLAIGYRLWNPARLSAIRKNR